MNRIRTSIAVVAMTLWALRPGTLPAVGQQSQSPSPSRVASPVASQPTPMLPACDSLAQTPSIVPAPAGPATSGVPAAGDLTVFAAASLTAAFQAFASAYQAETGLGPEFSFDASSALRTQIEQGAPADVFASADTTNVLTLLAEHLATDPVVFACNQLTIIVPAANPAGILSAADLARPGVKIVAARDEVPITRYAMQLVANLGISEAYSANVVSREDNVAAVRAKLETGEGDAGIVYLTDALASGDNVTQVPVPSAANVPATYAAAVVSSSDQSDASRAFLQWLVGSEGQAYLGRFGFLPAPRGQLGSASPGVSASPSTAPADALATP